MILQGAFTYFYLGAVLQHESENSNCGITMYGELGAPKSILHATTTKESQGQLILEQLATAAASLTEEQRLKLQRMLFDKSRP